MYSHIQTCIQNHVKHLRWIFKSSSYSYHTHKKKPLVLLVWLEHFCLVNLIVAIHLSFVLSLMDLKDVFDKYEINLLILATERPKYFENYTP